MRAAKLELWKAQPQKRQKFDLLSGYCVFACKIALQVFQSQVGDFFFILKTN